MSLIPVESICKVLSSTINQGFSIYRIVQDLKSGEILDFILMDTNKAFDEYTGIESASLIGTPISKSFTCLSPQDLNTFFAYYKRLVQGEIVKFERYSEIKDIWYTVSIYLIENKFILALFDDTRAVKRERRDLEHTVHRYKSLFDNVTDAILALRNNVVIDCNKAALELFNVGDIEDLVNRDFLDFSYLGSSNREANKLLFGSMLQLTKQNGKHSFEWQIIRQNTPIYVDISLSVFYDEENRPLYYAVLHDIDEKKRFESILKENEEKYRALANSTFEAIFILENDQCIEANYAAQKKFGYTESELIENFGLTLFAKTEHTKVIQSMKAMDVEPFETIAVCKNGDFFDAEYRQKVFDYKGVKRKVIAIRNISERKKAQRNVNKFISIINKSPVIVFIWKFEENWPVEFVSDNIRQFGYAQNEFLQGKISYSQIVYPEDRPQIERDLSKYVQLDVNENVREYRIITKSGEIKWVYDKTWILRDEKGSITHLEGVIYDITDVKNSEEELKKSEAKLKEQYAFLQELIDNIPNPVYYKDLDGNFLGVNKSFSEAFGINKDYLIGKKLYQVFPKNLAQIDFKNDQILLNTGKPQNYQQEIPLSDNLLHSVIINKSLFTDFKGNPAGIIGTIIDITDIKKMEFALIHAKEAAEVANHAKSEFLANMSHEIRTPMNAILGFAQILEENLRELPKHSEYIKGIIISGKNLLRLINDILDLSKIEAGKLDINYEPVNPHEIFTDIFQMFQLRAKEKGIGLVLNIDKHLPHSLLLDETRIRQILFNLVGNAIKFTHSGNVEVVVESKDKELLGSQFDICIKVKDSGIGISESQQNLIFEPFRQQKGQDNKIYGGTGLGLTITKRLVEMMNGNIKLTSQPGVGSEFIVFIPNVQVASISNQTIKDIKESIDPSQIIFEGSPKLLIVEDIESNRKVVKAFLEKYNIEIIEAENGKEGIDLARSITPQLILMDIQMPVMDGYTAINIMKNDEELKKIPIVALTASALKSQEIEIKALCNGYLRKPLSKYDLLVEILKHLPYHRKQVDIESPIIDTNIDFIQLWSDEFAGFSDKEKIVKVFKSEIMPDYNEISKSLYISKIKEYSQKLIKIAQQHNVKSIEVLANRLFTSCESFNIGEIKRLLGIIPTIYEKIK